MAQEKWVDLGTVEIKKITEKALLLSTESHGDIWMPQSQVATETAQECNEDAHLDEFWVTEWIATTKGLI